MKRRNLLSSPLLLLVSPARARGVPIAPAADYEQASGGHFGFYAENIRTGRQLAWRAGERFVMCSTFKASLAACVLAHVDGGGDDLDRPVRYGRAHMHDWHAPVAAANLARGWLTVGEMCQAAVEDSDNTCATLLLSRIGGPAALTAFWRGIGDHTTRLDDPELALNFRSPGDVRDTTTPAAMAANLRRFVLGGVLSDGSRRILTRWLVGCRTGGDRLRGGLPAAWSIGDKTGNNGTDAAGDIAIIWPRAGGPIVIAAYTRGGSPTPGQLRTAFAGIGRFVAQHLQEA